MFADESEHKSAQATGDGRSMLVAKVNTRSFFVQRCASNCPQTLSAQSRNTQFPPRLVVTKKSLSGL